MRLLQSGKCGCCGGGSKNCFVKSGKNCRPHPYLTVMGTGWLHILRLLIYTGQGMAKTAQVAALEFHLGDDRINADETNDKWQYKNTFQQDNMVLWFLPRSTSRNQLSSINLGWASNFWARIVIKSNGDA